MNIFVLDEDPVKAARMQCDAHVVKMILESAQMLSTAVREVTGYEGDEIYKRTHLNHPCSIWARESYQNFRWLFRHAMSLCFEYAERYGKTHKSMKVINQCMGILANSCKAHWGRKTPFAQAMPDEYKDKDAVVAYRNYYKYDKQVNMPRFTYKFTDKPDWL